MIKKIVNLALVVMIVGYGLVNNSTQANNDKLPLNVIGDTPIETPLLNYGEYADESLVDGGQAIFVQNQETNTIYYIQNNEQARKRIFVIDTECTNQSRFSYVVRTDMAHGAPLEYILKETTKYINDQNLNNSFIVNFSRIINDSYRSNLSDEELMLKTFDFCMNINGFIKYNVN